MFVFSSDVYVTMQITFLTHKRPPVRYVIFIVTSLASLDCNGVFAIKAYVGP